MVSENKIVLVPLETLMHTVPLAFTYLVYMVGILVLSFDCSFLKVLCFLPVANMYIG